MRTKLPQLTEYQDCVLFAEYLDILKQQGKIILYSHIPNSTWTPSLSVKLKNKKLGVSSGVPDYMIITSRGLLFFLEMKRKKNGVVSDNQKVWLRVLSELCEIPALVAQGFDEAKVIVDSLI